MALSLMTGERVFCSRLKRKVPTNLNPPRHRRERYCSGFVPRQRKERIACRFSLIRFTMRSVKILRAHWPLPHRQRPTCKSTTTGLPCTVSPAVCDDSDYGEIWTSWYMSDTPQSCCQRPLHPSLVPISPAQLTSHWLLWAATLLQSRS